MDGVARSAPCRHDAMLPIGNKAGSADPYVLGPIDREHTEAAASVRPRHCVRTTVRARLTASREVSNSRRVELLAQAANVDHRSRRADEPSALTTGVRAGAKRPPPPALVLIKFDTDELRRHTVAEAFMGEGLSRCGGASPLWGFTSKLVRVAPLLRVSSDCCDPHPFNCRALAAGVCLVVGVHPESTVPPHLRA